MRRAIVILTLLTVVPATRGEALHGFILFGERITFDDRSRPRFTDRQVRRTDGAMREGLARWAKTPHGRALIRRFDRPDYRIFVMEDAGEGGMGRAPQPAIGTMISHGSPSSVKVYQIILNPAFVKLPPADSAPFPEPKSAAELMAAAWAGEMLHIDFYSRGVVLPHHERADFQREWQEVATQLGYPALRHDDSR